MPYHGSCGSSLGTRAADLMDLSSDLPRSCQAFVSRTTAAARVRECSVSTPVEYVAVCFSVVVG